MSSIVRATLRRIITNNDNLLDVNKNLKLIRSITSRSTRAAQNLPPKPKPWPYQQKSYTLLNYFFDKTTARFDENTKIIVVDGPVAAGKSKFARQLAEELDMLYLPEANLDMTYINSYGYDLRKLDPQLPESCRSFDVMDFLKNPNHKHTIKFQLQQYIVRLSQYVDALAHVLSTGQGVILDRSVYSDFVFTEAMYRQGYLSRLAHDKYYQFRDCTISELLRPHLVIYLDVPVPKVLENIQKRAISYEKDSPVLNAHYLGIMEKQYKQHFLKDISTHSELLVYDWSEEGDVEIVIEDIERIDFNRHDVQDTQLKDWDHNDEEDWALLRHKYADRKEYIMSFCNIPCFDTPELVVDALEADTYHKVMAQAPGEEYEIGYNASLGDKGILFKMGKPQRETLPLRERRTSV